MRYARLPTPGAHSCAQEGAKGALARIAHGRLNCFCTDFAPPPAPAAHLPVLGGANGLGTHLRGAPAPRAE